MKENINEQSLRILFSSFLRDEKGYPSDSLLFEYPISRADNNRYLRADLILQNVEFSDLLALVEFKNSFNESNFTSAFFHVSNYLTFLGQPDLPAYLVCYVENDFSIFILDSNEKWIQINKTEFPSYQALSSISFAKEKNEKKTKKYKIEVKEQKERTITKVTTYISSISVIIGLLSFFITSKVNDKQSIELTKKQSYELMLIVDSINNKIIKSNSSLKQMSDSLTSYKMFIDSLSNYINGKDDKLKYKFLKDKEFLQTQKEIDDFSERIAKLEFKISNIENIIIDNPEKIITIPILKKDIENQQQVLESKIKIIENDNIWMKEKLNSYGSAGVTFIISILVALTSLIVGNILKSQKEK